MAAIVSDRFRDIVYSGDARYTAHLTINGNEISPRQIKSINISNPIIDDTQNSFYIGTFISQKIDITFKNIEQLDIQTGYEVDLSISLLVDGEQEKVQIGKYIIDNLAENYQKTNKITCLDYAIKFSPNVDYSVAFDENGEITLKNLLIWLCEHYGVELGTYPEINNDVKISVCDNTISGKRYISYIAEMFGGNAKIGRDGKLNIIPLNTNSAVTINALRSKSLTVGEKYKISQVIYFDAIRPFTFGDATDNTLIIRQENMFVVDESNIEAIYNVLNGFEIYSVTNENYGDISLDAWDILTLKVGEKEYQTLNNSTLTYEMNISTKINTTIPSKQQEVTTNVVANNDAERIRRVETRINQLDGTITLLSEDTSNIKLTQNNQYQEIMKQFEGYTPLSDTATLRERVEFIVTDTYTKQNVKEIISGTFVDEEGNIIQVSKTANKSGVFSNEGLRIQLEDENEKIISETSGLFNEIGLTVSKVENGNVVSGKPILFTGYVKSDNEYYGEQYGGQSITATNNIIVENYAVFGEHTRIENYTDDNGNTGGGLFII